jgi:pyruvate carboxylase
VGAPMPGTVISLHAKAGDAVKKGDKVAVLSAMKMETVVSAAKDGTVKVVHPAEGDLLSAGDLVLEIE